MMTNETGVNFGATTAILATLVVRSFGLATGIGIAMMLAAALISG